MPGADFYRALATAKFLKTELLHERDAHNAMKLCFEKIHQSLDMYQGHYINRLRFHLNRHHTEYLRKVRVMRKEKDAKQMEEDETRPTTNSRRSMRVGVAQELANEVEQLRRTIKRKDFEIERLAMLVDEQNTTETPPMATPSTRTPNPPKRARVDKLMNPYLPSSSSCDEDDTPSAAP